jgi:hypothetical protein
VLGTGGGFVETLAALAFVETLAALAALAL